MRHTASRGEALPRKGPLFPHSGFTLLEVIIALSISTFVILGARMLLEHLGGASDRVIRSTRALDQDANGERLLRSLVGQIEVGVQEASFSGDERTAQFNSWCRVARGWLERCRVKLSIDSEDGRPSLVATLSGGARVVLRQAKRDLRLRYLVDAHEGGTWLAKWGDGLVAPRALGILIDSDTLLVRIGERG